MFRDLSSSVQANRRRIRNSLTFVCGAVNAMVLAQADVRTLVATIHEIGESSPASFVLTFAFALVAVTVAFMLGAAGASLLVSRARAFRRANVYAPAMLAASVLVIVLGLLGGSESGLLWTTLLVLVAFDGMHTALTTQIDRTARPGLLVRIGIDLADAMAGPSRQQVAELKQHAASLGFLRLGVAGGFSGAIALGIWSALIWAGLLAVFSQAQREAALDDPPAN